jgi:hypothetical protein
VKPAAAHHDRTEIALIGDVEEADDGGAMADG